MGRLTLSIGNVKDSAFVSPGFSNWKDGIAAFESHEKSATHKRAVEGVITLPKTTRDIGELISSAHAAEKRKTNSALLLLLKIYTFLQGRGLLSVEMVMKVIVICTVAPS